MQDPNTGHMHPIGADKIKEEQEKARVEQREPPCIISVGETFQLNGGNFRVKSIGKKFLMLEGMPGTKTYPSIESYKHAHER